MTYKGIPQSEVLLRSVVPADLQAALQRTRSSVQEQELAALQEFRLHYGAA